MIVVSCYSVREKHPMSGPDIQYKMNCSGVEVDWDAYGRLNNPDYEPEDRGTIEVPADSETVIYESPDGETYEISISDLIDADTDGEIEYRSKGRSGLSNKRKGGLSNYGRFVGQPAVLLKQKNFACTR